MPTKQKGWEPGAGGKIGRQTETRQEDQAKRTSEAVTTKTQKGAQSGQDRGGMGDMKSSKKNK